MSGKAESDGQCSTLSALQKVAQSHGVHIAVDQIIRDYGLDGRETPIRTLMKIADENGLVARSTRLSWRQLSQLGQSLPIILQLRNGAAMVLVGYRPGEKGQADVALLRPANQSDESCLAIDEIRLAAAWDGQAIFIKRRHKPSIDEKPFGFPWLLQQVARERRIFRDVGIAALIMSLFAIVPPFTYLIIVDRVLVYQRLSTLYVLVVGVLFVILFDTVFGYLRRYLVVTGTARVDARINTYIFNRMVRLPLDFFEQTPAGTISYKLNEIWRVRQFLTEQMFGMMLDMLTLLAIIPAMFLLNSTLTFMVLGIGLVMCVIVLAYMRPLGRLQQRVIAAEVEKGSFMIEVLHGMRTVKSLALENRKQMGWDVRVAEAVRAKTAFMLFGNQPQTILQPLEKLIYAGVLMTGSYMAITQQVEMFAGTLIAFTMLSGRATAPLVQISAMIQHTEEIRSAIAQVASVVNIPPEQSVKNGVRPVINGTLSLSDVRFRYPGAVTFALDGISLDIEAGTLVGIMGRSGSGKTTVTRLLQGLHQSYEGLIKINGIDLRQFDLHHLRSNLGVVLQDNFLFRGTIRENILVTRPNASFEEVTEAARLSGAEEFIDRLPQGYETPIEEGGTNLSGGQRQRIAIARALLGKPSVLIFDEATSALDPDSEAIINNNLKRIARGRTVIVISHRLASLVDCDKIVVLERGRLYDSGAHQELMGRCDIYRHLWFQQNRHLAADPSMHVANHSVTAING
ncbi:peptidase C39 [Azospirillum sp. TSH64]|nr:peptidase C39 [Azospirillum sp. TSH64]